MLSPVFTLPIPPFSANQMYRNVPKVGRVRTSKYNKWRDDLYLLLPMIDINPELPVIIRFKFGTAHFKSFDLDNMVKPVVDVMQAKWNFNDKMVVEYRLRKLSAKKYSEYIEFTIEQETP